MRRTAVAIILAAGLVPGLASLSGCTAEPEQRVVPVAPQAPVTEESPSQAPPLSQDLCARVRQTTTALGPGVVKQFRDQGMPPAQVLETVRAVYQLAEAQLAQMRGQATDARLKGAIAAIEAQYRDIRTRLKTPSDLDRVNFAPRTLGTAVGQVEQACG